MLLYLLACDLLTSPAATAVDTDADGVEADLDCDDADPAVFPGALELCNTVDDDCDDEVDEGLRVPLYVDADLDGYGAGYSVAEGCPTEAGYAGYDGDCDDTDAAVHPGATELCNRVDDDCDGVLDVDDAGEAVAWYTDADGDGYGDPATVELTCAPDDTQVLVAGDCDDLSASTHAGATEQCNETDDDCDGGIDEEAVDALTWHPDLDGDGYGDPDLAYVLCGTPEGLTLDASDCDDTEGNRNPAAVEVCNNHFPDDCDVDDDGCDPAGTVTAEDADGVWDLGGYVSLGGCADLDGDGREDLLVATEDRVYALEGAWDTLSEWDSLVYDGSSGIATYGIPVSPVGDSDGDGTVEVAILGEEAGTYDLRLEVVSGPWGGEAAADVASTTVVGFDRYYHWPAPVHVGDMDGDGDAELLVRDLNGVDAAGTYVGEVRLFAGPLAAGEVHVDDAGATIQGTDASGSFGAAAAGGDVDGDGLSDLAVAGAGGSAYVWYGGPALLAGGVGTTDSADAVFTASTTGALDLGDLDGDGRADLVLGDHLAFEVGAVRVFRADAGGLASGDESDADLVIQGIENEHDAGIGGQLRVVGDVNADGVEDLVLADYDSLAEIVHAWLFYDTSAFSLTTDDASLTVEHAQTYLRLGEGGDVDGDGFDDLPLAAWDYDASAAYLFYGAGI